MINKNKLTEIWNHIIENNVNIIAGRPGVGKDGLLMNMVLHTSINRKQSIYVTSQSKCAGELVMDILFKNANITSEEKHSGKLTSDEWQKLSKLIKELIHANIHFSDYARNSLEKIKEEVFKFDSKIVIIDMSELLEEFGDSEDREEKYQNLISAMREITKNHGITLISFFTLTREPIKKQIERLNPKIIISENSSSDESSKENILWIEPIKSLVK